MNPKKTIAIIGGGASALSFACSIDTTKFDVTIYEKNTTLGRKFLVAGSGGFNLTHSENANDFIKRYTPSHFMAPFINRFTNVDFRAWLLTIGIETYVGTSKRVFPKKGIKPIQVLQAIETALQKNTIKIAYEHTWLGFENELLHFKTKQSNVLIKADYKVFALGGASWKVTGSNTEWLNYFKEKNITTLPFQSSNSAFEVKWGFELLKQIESKAIKNAMFSCENKQHKGEAVVTAFGIEGSGVYPLSSFVREQLNHNGKAIVTIDFKPDLTLEEVKQRLINNSQLSTKDILEKKINLTSTHIALLKAQTTKEQYQSVDYLSKLIKIYPITIIGLAPLDEAISTAGGICLSSINADLELKELPSYYCMGEMLNWDAPTGGYLLQACFSMGYTLANKFNKE